MRKTIDVVLRYKILHILFWFVKTILLIHELSQNSTVSRALTYADALNTTFFQMVCVYTAIYILIPRLFLKEKYFQFIITIIILIAACSLADILFQVFYVKSFFNAEHKISFTTALITFIGLYVDMTIVSVIFIVIALVYHFYMRDQKNKLIERERLESELNFLKAQINPHFLFNALNSIYVLMKEDVHLSEEVLLKFSDLLRYQLYDCSSNETTLEKEIEFLKNYIALENIRHGENTKIYLDFPEKSIYLKVAPFILIPFIENAFKHISHYRDKENWIKISLVCSQGLIDVTISNTFEEMPEPVHHNHKGIGLQNVKRRLELLYSQKHTLEISSDNDQYTARLTLVTDEH